MNTVLDSFTPPAVHEWTGPTGVKFRDVRSACGNYYHDTTPPAVVQWLDHAMRTGERVRIWLGDRATGKGWLEENDVCGRVGRSTGWKKTALLLASERSNAGSAILADCIVRLDVSGRTVYTHPGFTLPQISVYPDSAFPACPWSVEVNGQKGFARFKTETAAKRWSAFMRGERGTP